MRKPLTTLSLLVPLTLLPLLTACPPRVANTPNGVGSQNARTGLKVRFEITDPKPEYFSKITKAEIKLTGTSGATVSDSFDFSASSSTTEIERSLSNVPTGLVEAEVRLLGADGQTVVPALKTSFDLSTTTTDVALVKLTTTPRLLPPLVTSGQSLATLRAQRRDLLLEIQRLSGQESEIIIQIAPLRGSTVLEDQNLRRQLQVDLQGLQNQLASKKVDLEKLNGQLDRLEAQTSGGAASNGALQDQVFDLRLQAGEISKGIDQLLNQRRQLSIEARSLAGGSGGSAELSQIQGEIKTLDGQIEERIRQLQTLNLQLQALESRLTSQSTELPPDQRKAQLEADLILLKARITTLETELPDLRRRFEALAQRTDLLSVQRREALDIEIKGKEAELSQSKTLQVEIETQLKGL